MLDMVVTTNTSLTTDQCVILIVGSALETFLYCIILYYEVFQIHLMSSCHFWPKTHQPSGWNFPPTIWLDALPYTIHD